MHPWRQTAADAFCLDQSNSRHLRSGRNASAGSWGARGNSWFAEDNGVRQGFVDGNPAPLTTSQPPSLSVGKANSVVVEPSEMDFIPTAPRVLPGGSF
jgi:hypothetical protein